MATRAIKPKRDDSILTGWQSIPEQAPSVMRDDQPTVARILAMAGVMLTAIGILAMVAPAAGWTYVVGSGWGAFALSVGLILILHHAFVDKDTQYRRVYMAAGLLLGALGVALRFLPLGGTVGGLFLPYGFYSLALALLFILAVLRHEDSKDLRSLLLGVLGAVAAVMILAGLVVGQFNPDFLAGEGVLLLMLGLFYAGAFIGMQDTASDTGYRAAFALGSAGAVTLIITCVRVLAPAFGSGGGDTVNSFLVPSGLILLGASIVYIAVALAVCSDWPLVVLVRRQLAAFFYSPMAYLVFLAMMFVSWANFILFVQRVVRSRENPRMLIFEPIVHVYIIGIFILIIAQLFVVPVLTMRLFSEEKRSGTLEMLLTVPVNESTIVLSKFFGAWIFYLLTWVPTFLFLVGLRAFGADEFDYRPVLSFFFTLAASGAGFIGMGLFFSSITRNQIIAAVFTFLGMTLFLCFTILGYWLQGSIWADVFSYVSFYDLWDSSLEGGVLARAT